MSCSFFPQKDSPQKWDLQSNNSKNKAKKKIIIQWQEGGRMSNAYKKKAADSWSIHTYMKSCTLGSNTVSTQWKTLPH